MVIIQFSVKSSQCDLNPVLMRKDHKSMLTVVSFLPVSSNAWREPGLGRDHPAIIGVRGTIIA